MANANLTNAKKAKNDEFYTQLTDIEKEMRHYKDFFKGKVVYCNCDDARESNFFKYFSLNFEHLGLKKLISTGFKADGKGVVLIYEGDKNGNRIVDDNEIIVNELEGDGDFRSAECIEFLKECDVVVTNPPFSLFREYVAQLMGYGKKFLIIGNMNAITYKEIFPYIKNNELWLGCRTLGSDFFFNVPEDYKEELMTTKTQGGGWKIIDGEVMGRVASACWFTNIPHNKRNTELDLYRKYDTDAYPKYDNYDAIEVSKVSEIPMDYEGVMGVPITFLDKYCPSQFEILDARNHTSIDKLKSKSTFLVKDKDSAINGKPTYARILIKRRA
jgi:hypothetical protein